MMLNKFFRRLILRNKHLILFEAQGARDFMDLLMKHRNTDIPWSQEEIKQLKSYLVHMSFYIPCLMIFLLPGGQFLLPVLAEVLDRRSKKRQVPLKKITKSLNGTNA
jgi:hypothetical protein